jgi:Ca-activated chloride channel family protein
MTDENGKLRKILKQEPQIDAPAGAKKRALAKVMEAYDAKNRAADQGIGVGSRLMGTAHAVYEILIGRKTMRLTPAMAGGAGLSVLLIATLSATYIHQRNWNDPLKPANPAETQPLGQKARVRSDERKQSVTPSPDQKPLTSTPEQDAQAAGGARMAGEQERTVAKIAPPAPVAAPLAGVTPQRAAPTQKRFSPQSRVAQGISNLADRRLPFPERPSPGAYQDQGRNRFEAVQQNPVKVTREDPVSTFSIDVDTASYSFVRKSLNNNVLPPKDAVRVEELVNYFPYDYAKPRDRAVPFEANVSVFPSPWNTNRKLLHIGIAGFEMGAKEKPPSNLVFLLDTSGSMNAPDKLPLVINSMKLLLDTLRADDTVAIVTYAGNAGTALEPTQVRDKVKIVAALNRLTSRGSTAGAEGIRQAYDLARQNLKKDGVNRVILATDGDFNVGITDKNELKSFVERQRNSGVFLSVLGFGRGNYNDALMQVLAQNGNGNAAYIDTLSEARKVLVEEASSTLFPIAKDVKLQIEFNPLKVAEYRLIGYETRMLKREDFNNDKVDAGDIGAGHRVTAIYELTPAGGSSPSVDPLRYGAERTGSDAPASSEYGFLKIRYKLPKDDASKLITTPIDTGVEIASVDAAPNEARFGAAVAAFGQILKGGKYTGSYSYDDVIELAQGARGKDTFGYRAEFINLVRLAKSAPGMEPLQRR